MITSVETENR